MLRQMLYTARHRIFGDLMDDVCPDHTTIIADKKLRPVTYCAPFFAPMDQFVAFQLTMNCNIKSRNVGLRQIATCLPPHLLPANKERRYDCKSKVSSFTEYAFNSMNMVKLARIHVENE